MIDQLRAYLSEHGVTLTEFPRKESFAVEKQWTSVFGRFRRGLRTSMGRGRLVSFGRTQPKSDPAFFVVAYHRVSDIDQPTPLFRMFVHW